MRNRAKCKLCSSIIESLTKEDHISCECGEIEISGGNEAFLIKAKDFTNFIRIAEDDSEIKPVIMEKKKEQLPLPAEMQEQKITQTAAIFKEMVQRLERMKIEELTSPMSHQDFLYFLYLFADFLELPLER